MTIIHRFRAENMMQTSAALAFTTLLALVPLATLLISISSALPVADSLMKRFDALMVSSLLPPSSAGVISAHIAKFTAKARAMTLPGIAMLVVTAFLMLHTVEQAFNHLWRVRPRPILQRVRLYAFVMVVWPFLMGGVAMVVTYAVTASLGFFDEDALWMRRIAFQSLSVVLLGLFFAFLYYAVPNAKVSKRAALVGGVFSALSFSAMQQGFELYLATIGTFRSVYGAFAAAPIFLIWVHLSWALVLTGGLIAATAGRRSRR